MLLHLKWWGGTPGKGLEPDALRAFCFARNFRPRPKPI